MTSQTHGQTGVKVFVFNCETHFIFTNVKLISYNKINRLEIISVLCLMMITM